MSVALSQPRDPGFTVPAVETRRRARASRAYLVVSTLLAPVVVPAGPGQTAVLDVVNLFAILAFAYFVVFPGRQTLRVPLLAPTVLVAIGSLIACAWAPSMSLAALALAQDAYLFAWFVVLVNLLHTRRDLRLVRVAWVWTAVLVSLGALAQLLFATGGSLGTLLGIGPGNSASLTMGLADRERPDSYRSKEAHSDYLAFAIERGPLGIVGLLGLLAALFAQVAVYWRASRRTSGGAPRRARLWTAAMLAVLAGSVVHSLVIEKLHFRHYWLFIALLCASALISTGRTAGDPVEAA